MARFSNSSQSPHQFSAYRTLRIAALPGSAADVGFGDACRCGEDRQRLRVQTAARDDPEAAPGMCCQRRKMRAALDWGPLATAREDAIDLRKPADGVEGPLLLAKSLERAMKRRSQPRSRLEHLCDIVQSGLTIAIETHDNPVHTE